MGGGGKVRGGVGGKSKFNKNGRKKGFSAKDRRNKLRRFTRENRRWK